MPVREEYSPWSLYVSYRSRVWYKECIGRKKGERNTLYTRSLLYLTYNLLYLTYNLYIPARFDPCACLLRLRCEFSITHLHSASLPRYIYTA